MNDFLGKHKNKFVQEEEEYVNNRIKEIELLVKSVPTSCPHKGHKPQNAEE